MLHDTCNPNAFEWVPENYEGQSIIYLNNVHYFRITEFKT